MAKKAATPRREAPQKVRMLGREVLAVEYVHAGTGQRMRHDFKAKKRPPMFVSVDGKTLIIQPVKVGQYIED